MKPTSSQKIKIGLFVLIGLTIVFLGVFLIGNQKGRFTSTFNVYGVFKNVNGLQEGNNVRFAGINVGVVESIELLNDTSVKVLLTIKSDVKKFIKKDAKVSISTDGLMGDKLVVIRPGGASTSVHVDGGERLTAVNPFDVDKLMVKGTKIVDNTGLLIENLSTMISKINSGKGSLGRLLNDDRMAKEMESTVKQAKSTIANVHKTSNTLNEDLKAAQHNFLLKGFFKKKKKAEQAKKDSLKKAQEHK